MVIIITMNIIEFAFLGLKLLAHRSPSFFNNSLAVRHLWEVELFVPKIHSWIILIK